MPPRHEPTTPRPIKPRPEKMALLIERGFSWEVIKQLFEGYWLEACYQNDVLRPGDAEESPNRMVLQFQQDSCYYRMAFELLENDFGPHLPPVEAKIVTIFNDGCRAALPECPVQILDGSFDLPLENIP